MQRCICGGLANGSSTCGCDVCPLCRRHYTDSGNHRRGKTGQHNVYPCGCPVVTAAKSRGAVRSARIRDERTRQDRRALARWNAATKGA